MDLISNTEQWARRGLFNGRQMRDRALYEFNGLLLGLMADRQLRDDEIHFLDLWLVDHTKVHHLWPVSEVAEKVSAVLADGVITEAERADLKKLIDSVVNYDTDFNRSMNALLGICRGLPCDQVLNEQEVVFLKNWLNVHPALLDSYPGKQLGERLMAIMADGQVTQNELEELKAYLYAITGETVEQGVSDGLATTLPIDDSVDLVHQGRSFCFTGTFAFGNRKKCHERTESLGGVPAKSITKALDYLVLGEIVTNAWQYSSHGRKIEKAMNYGGIAIISEERWLSVG